MQISKAYFSWVQTMTSRPESQDTSTQAGMGRTKKEGVAIKLYMVSKSKVQATPQHQFLQPCDWLTVILLRQLPNHWLSFTVVYLRFPNISCWWQLDYCEKGFVSVQMEQTTLFSSVLYSHTNLWSFCSVLDVWSHLFCTRYSPILS